jgi:hypothetical protein
MLKAVMYVVRRSLSSPSVVASGHLLDWLETNQSRWRCFEHAGVICNGPKTKPSFPRHPKLLQC